MNKKTIIFAFIFVFCYCFEPYCQNSQITMRQFTPTEQYPERDTSILNKIDAWQDLKFGFLMHWGLYTQKALVESWSICNEDWIDRKGEPYEPYKQWYWGLAKEFNPQGFDAHSWAKAAKQAGMKYVVFTAKHHDGFCMFDTKYTDYKITNPTSLYYKQDGRDVVKEVLDAFKREGFWLGLYFSKADWHDSCYWSPLWATPDRNVNYDINKYPDKWKRFSDFTFNQIYELTHNYQPLDILWLDAGWIRPSWSVTFGSEEEKWLGAYKRIQDINMPKIAAMAREKNSDMIIVDRSVGGQFENYKTPEQQIPSKPLDYPWETCMTMGDSWSYVPNDNYKSTNTIIHLLCEIVCKGGNFLLNVGPDAQGNLPKEALQRMDSIGLWLQTYGEAIYNTRPIAPYKYDNVCLTQSKDGKIYAIILLSDSLALQQNYNLALIDGVKQGKKRILSSNQKATLNVTSQGLHLTLPKQLLKTNKEPNALVIQIQ